MSQDSFRTTHYEPRWPHDGSNAALRCLKTASRWPKIAPRQPHDGSRKLQDGPKMVQDGLKIDSRYKHNSTLKETRWPNRSRTGGGPDLLCLLYRTDSPPPRHINENRSKINPRRHLLYQTISRSLRERLIKTRRLGITILILWRRAPGRCKMALNVAF